MTRTVVGLYEHFQSALEVLQELTEGPASQMNISLVARDLEPGGEELHREGIGHPLEERFTSDLQLNVPLNRVAVPQMGPMIAGGPLLETLRGAEVGNATGRLIEALTEAGVPEADANIYVEGVRGGATLVVAYTEDEAADRAAEVMNRHQPVDITGSRPGQGEEKKEGWQGFNETPETFAFQNYSPPYKEREASSPLDYGPGARSYLAGMPISEYDRRKADLGNYQNFVPGDWSTYEPRFEKHFYNRSGSLRGRWEDFRDIYRHGFESGFSGRYAGKDWDAARTDIRREWEQKNPNRRWEDYEDFVHQGWRGSRGEDMDALDENS